MNIREQILKKRGLKYSDLDPEERESLEAMVKDVKNNDITVDDVKKHVKKIKESIINQLVDIGDETWNFWYVWRRRRHLRARLQNIQLMEDVLYRPERMKERLEKQFSGGS